MGENKRLVIVGVFVFAALAILVTGVFTLGGQQKKFQKNIVLTAVFNDVAGLRPGNNIWFSGVKIGTVKKIEFTPESKVLITMKIDEDVKPYIKRDSKVKIGSEGFIGNKIIEIFGGNKNGPPVEDEDKLLAAETTGTEEIMETLQANNKNLLSITSDLKVLSGSLVNGEGLAGALLTDTTMTLKFRKIVTDLEQVSQNTIHMSYSLNKFTEKLNTEGGLANKILTDTVVFRDIQSATNQLGLVTASLQQTSNKLNQKDNALGMFLNDDVFASNLKTTMKNLETSTFKLDQNMEALQHNFLLRRYFKKQEKDKKNK